MIGDGKPLKVRVEFSLEDPLGGVQVNQFVFVICAGLYKVSFPPLLYPILKPPRLFKK